MGDDGCAPVRRSDLASANRFGSGIIRPGTGERVHGGIYIVEYMVGG